MILLDKDNFQAEVLDADGYILVDFFGDGCGPCAALMPQIEEIAEKYKDKAKFCKLNTTKARRLAIGQRVLGLPTITLYKGGQKVAELTKDDATQEKIEDMILTNIG